MTTGKPPAGNKPSVNDVLKDMAQGVGMDKTEIKVEVKGESHATAPQEPDKLPKGYTTADAQKAVENVVVDKDIRPAVTKMIEQERMTGAGREFMSTMTEEQLAKIDWSKIDETNMMFIDAIVARDLKLPSYLDLKLKDPAYEGRWVNRKYDGEGGNRYEQMVAMGFTNVRPDECKDGQFDPNRIKTDGNTIVCNDLIFMKIHKMLIYGMYKKNLLNANRSMAKGNVHQQAKDAGVTELRNSLQGAGVNRSAYAGKLSMFIPKTNPLDPSSTDI